MPNIAQIDPYQVQNISVLKRQNFQQARALLEKVARQVQPILRRRYAGTFQDATCAQHGLSCAYHMLTITSVCGHVSRPLHAGNGMCRSCQSSTPEPVSWCAQHCKNEALRTSVALAAQHASGCRLGFTGTKICQSCALQGLNIGGGGGGTQEIKIRLRHHDDASHFLEWHSVMGTMLHGALQAPPRQPLHFDIRPRKCVLLPESNGHQALLMDWRVCLHHHAHSLLPCPQRWRTTSSPRTTPSSSSCGTSCGRCVAQLWDRLPWLLRPTLLPSAQILPSP
jgi:WLM domain